MLKSSRLKQWRDYYHRHKAARRLYEKLHPELRALKDAKQRCTNINSAQYKDYGGRGIKCFLKSYHEILNSIGKRPSKLYTLDRINNNGDYEIDNIRWATRKQQSSNRRK